MLKTIKVKKQLRLDDLLKEVWDEGLPARVIVSDKGMKEITIMPNGIDCNYINNGIITREDTFTVEVEEEFSRDTVFNRVAIINSYGNLDIYDYKSINAALKGDGADCFAIKIYAFIGNSLELIWERDEE